MHEICNLENVIQALLPLVDCKFSEFCFVFVVVVVVVVVVF